MCSGQSHFGQQQLLHVLGVGFAGHGDEQPPSVAQLWRLPSHSRNLRSKLKLQRPGLSSDQVAQELEVEKSGIEI
jgi:hypothetical protein